MSDLLQVCYLNAKYKSMHVKYLLFQIHYKNSIKTFLIYYQEQLHQSSTKTHKCVNDKKQTLKGCAVWKFGPTVELDHLLLH